MAKKTKRNENRRDKIEHNDKVEFRPKISNYNKYKGLRIPKQMGLSNYIF